MKKLLFLQLVLYGLEVSVVAYVQNKAFEGRHNIKPKTKYDDAIVPKHEHTQDDPITSIVYQDSDELYDSVRYQERRAKIDLKQIEKGYLHLKSGKNSSAKLDEMNQLTKPDSEIARVNSHHKHDDQTAKKTAGNDINNVSKNSTLNDAPEIYWYQTILKKQSSRQPRYFSSNFVDTNNLQSSVHVIVKRDDVAFLNELKELEDTENKLNELIGQTALAEELEPLLDKLRKIPMQCPYNVPSMRVKHNCYSIETIRLKFDIAQRFCEVRGGSLALEPFTEEVWLTLWLGYPPLEHVSENFWLGATDEKSEGIFNFLNGKPLHSIDGRWEINHPSLTTSKNCLAIRNTREISFIDMDCQDKLRFICQYNLTAIGQETYF